MEITIYSAVIPKGLEVLNLEVFFFTSTFPLPFQLLFGTMLKWHKSLGDNKHKGRDIQGHSNKA